MDTWDLTRHPSGTTVGTSGPDPSPSQTGPRSATPPRGRPRPRHSPGCPPLHPPHVPRFTRNCFCKANWMRARERTMPTYGTQSEKARPSFSACSRTLCSKPHWMWTPPSSSKASARRGCSGLTWMARMSPPRANGSGLCPRTEGVTPST